MRGASVAQLLSINAIVAKKCEREEEAEEMVSLLAVSGYNLKLRKYTMNRELVKSLMFPTCLILFLP